MLNVLYIKLEPYDKNIMYYEIILIFSQKFGSIRFLKKSLKQSKASQIKGDYKAEAKKRFLNKIKMIMPTFLVYDGEKVLKARFCKILFVPTNCLVKPLASLLCKTNLF